jgi:hypothetical protein
MCHGDVQRGHFDAVHAGLTRTSRAICLRVPAFPPRRRSSSIGSLREALPRPSATAWPPKAEANTPAARPQDGASPREAAERGQERSTTPPGRSSGEQPLRRRLLPLEMPRGVNMRDSSGCVNRWRARQDRPRRPACCRECTQERTYQNG